MPVHDWSRVRAGTSHHFHTLWIAEISNALNGGVLPPDYYAMAEQRAGKIVPDVLTLRSPAPREDGPDDGADGGGVAIAVAPPRTRYMATAEVDPYVLRRRTVVVRRSSDDRIVALIEILSPGNKSSRRALGSFVDKAIGSLMRGRHLLLIDVHRPTPRDPQGIHGAVWSEFGDDAFAMPADKPLTLAAYAAGEAIGAYVEPVAVGDDLPQMPLFLTPARYVNAPLEATYRAAWRGVPRRWRDVLEPPPL